MAYDQAAVSAKGSAATLNFPVEYAQESLRALTLGGVSTSGASAGCSPVLVLKSQEIRASGGGRLCRDGTRGGCTVLKASRGGAVMSARWARTSGGRSSGSSSMARWLRRRGDRPFLTQSAHDEGDQGKEASSMSGQLNDALCDLRLEAVHDMDVAYLMFEEMPTYRIHIVASTNTCTLGLRRHHQHGTRRIFNWVTSAPPTTSACCGSTTPSMWRRSPRRRRHGERLCRAYGGLVQRVCGLVRRVFMKVDPRATTSDGVLPIFLRDQLPDAALGLATNYTSPPCSPGCGATLPCRCITPPP